MNYLNFYNYFWMGTCNCCYDVENIATKEIYVVKTNIFFINICSFDSVPHDLFVSVHTRHTNAHVKSTQILHVHCALCNGKYVLSSFALVPISMVALQKYMYIIVCSTHMIFFFFL